MDRRNFLRLLGLAPVAASTKAYSFLGNILRPKPSWDLMVIDRLQLQRMERLINPPLIASNGQVFYVNYKTYRMLEAQVFKEWLTH